MFGKNLKQIRQHISATQEEFANILGIPYRTYTAYERNENKPTLSMLDVLCKKCNVNLNWFISGIGEMFNAPKYEEVQDEFEKKVEEILKKKGLV